MNKARLLIAALVLIGLVSVAGARLGDLWAIQDLAGNDIWRITSSGTLTSGTGALDVQKRVSQSHAGNANLTASSPEVNYVTNMAAGIYLPDATACSGKPLIIKANTASTGNITVYANGSQTIDGSATALVTTRGALHLQSDGSNWAILNKLNQ